MYYAIKKGEKYYARDSIGVFWVEKLELANILEKEDSANRIKDAIGGRIIPVELMKQKLSVPIELVEQKLSSNVCHRPMGVCGTICKECD